MSKDLEKEYLEDLDHYDEGMGIHSSSYKKCKERLIKLAKIENSKPSEALECLERIIITKPYKTFDEFDNDYKTIKQSLLKAQEENKND